EKVRHARPMGALEKVTTADDLQAFIGRANNGVVVVQPKIDGCTLELVYMRGSLIRAITRGDGHEGEDVTKNARRVQGVPLSLANTVDCSVRCEVVLPICNWEN